MEKLILSFAVGSTWLTFLLGTWHVSLTILLVFMAIDIVTGIIKALVQKKLNSKIGYKGFLRKATIMLVIIIANLLDVLAGGGTPVFRTMAVFFYIGLEGLSIFENMGHIGIKLPMKLTKYIEQLSNEELPIDRKE